MIYPSSGTFACEHCLFDTCVHAPVAIHLFRFAIQLGMLPLTGTTDGTHMRHDLDIFDFTLTQDETETMLALGESR
jgi:diketogulonate reductase-like aldo/keto reductase